jgi:three-Cys-motif partner protein
MSRKHYDYSNGPSLIEPHSIAKHRVLQTYLAAYFQTLVSSPNQDEFRLTLVDGFAGGGEYHDPDSKEILPGSPLIMLDAVKEATFELNKDRRKPVHLDVSYFFVEKNRNTAHYLKQTLINRGFERQFDQSIFLRNADFLEQIDEVIDFIKKKSPRNGRSIFMLDQYAYKDVPASVVKRILRTLPRAEVILTFGVDSLINFVGDNEVSRGLLLQIGIPDALQGRTIDEIKSSEKEWRLFIQGSLYKSLIEKCGAEYYTPFFIRNRQGFGDYWLIHMSQHHRARDVMTEVHWKNNNYFIHYGGAGLDMFGSGMVGYDATFDTTRSGQGALSFEFDDVARNTSIESLLEQIPRYIYAHEDGMSFGELFATTCNGSPASAGIYRSAIVQLIEQKVLVAKGDGESLRRAAAQIRFTDQLIAPNQRSLFIGGT